MPASVASHREPETQVARVPDSNEKAHRSDRWFVKVGLLGLSAVLPTAAVAPLRQFSLACGGLGSVLIGIARSRSVRGAFGWTYLAGFLFFLLNLLYLLRVTVPGAMALPLYLALYSGLAGAAIKKARLLDAPAATCGSILLRALALA